METTILCFHFWKAQDFIKSLSSESQGQDHGSLEVTVSTRVCKIQSVHNRIWPSGICTHWLSTFSTDPLSPCSPLYLILSLKCPHHSCRDQNEVYLFPWLLGVTESHLFPWLFLLSPVHLWATEPSLSEGHCADLLSPVALPLVLQSILGYSLCAPMTQSPRDAAIWL